MLSNKKKYTFKIYLLFNYSIYLQTTKFRDAEHLGTPTYMTKSKSFSSRSTQQNCIVNAECTMYVMRVFQRL